MKVTALTGIALSLLSSVSFGDCVPHICQDVYVEKLYSNTNGVIYVATSGDETKLNCNAVSDLYVTFNLSDPSGDAYYSTFLAAQMSDRKVSIRVVTGSEGCNIQYITHERQ